MADRTGHTEDMTTTMTPDQLATYHARTMLKRLKAWNNRADKWFAACAELHEAKSDPDPVRYHLAQTTWNRLRPPGKASKCHAYGDAARLIDLLDLDLPRPQNRDDLKAVAAAAARELS